MTTISTLDTLIATWNHCAADVTALTINLAHARAAYTAIDQLQPVGMLKIEIRELKRLAGRAVTALDEAVDVACVRREQAQLALEAFAQAR